MGTTFASALGTFWLRSTGSPMFNRIRGLLWRARDTARDYLHPGHREEVFTRIHSENLWGNAESRSGAGSSIAATASVCDQLPVLWKRYNIRSLVDAPCGDCNWIPPIAATLESYTGVDLVRTIIEANRARHPNLAFLHADLTRDVLPKADAILCRALVQRHRDRQRSAHQPAAGPVQLSASRGEDRRGRRRAVSCPMAAVTSSARKPS
jgi:hypothetical protein